MKESKLTNSFISVNSKKSKKRKTEKLLQQMLTLIVKNASQILIIH